MTSENRQPHEDMFLAAADAARLRQVPAACSMLMTRAEAASGPRFTAAAQGAAGAAGPGALAGDVSLAIDVTDFSSPARRAR